MTNWITVADSVKARERAVQVERDRIIALLEEMVHVYLLEKLLVEAAIVENAIAVIKEPTNA
jgi:hypothetical protein